MKTLLASLVLLAAVHLAPAQTPRPGSGLPHPPFDIHYTPPTNSSPLPPGTNTFTAALVAYPYITFNTNGITTDTYTPPPPGNLDFPLASGGSPLTLNGITTDTFTSPTAVPEPSTIVFLLTVGLLFSIALMRRKTWGTEL